MSVPYISSLSCFIPFPYLDISLFQNYRMTLIQSYNPHLILFNSTYNIRRLVGDFFF